MEYLGYFSIDKKYLRNIDEFDYLLDKFLFTFQENNTLDTQFTNEKIRKRVYVKNQHYKELFEMAKQKAKVKGNIDLNKLINTILSQNSNLINQKGEKA